MKITVSINLGGYSFNIDEDAYAELKRYLKNLELHFAGEESSSEILSDIETRMAELFRTKLTGYKQVITLTMSNRLFLFSELLKILPIMKEHQHAINSHLPAITDVPRSRSQDYWRCMLRNGSILGYRSYDYQDNFCCTYSCRRTRSYCISDFVDCPP